MARFFAGVGSALLFMAAGLFLWQGMGSGQAASPDVEAPAPVSFFGDVPKAPSAPEKSREEKRFNRYDKDKNGLVSAAEYLASRQKAYAKLDTNGDGVLQFNEYAVKTRDKFDKADADKSGGLARAEFATTRPIRKTRPKPECPPSPAPFRQPEASADEGDDAA